MTEITDDNRAKNASEWYNPAPFGFKSVLLVIVIFTLMTLSAKNIELDKLISLSAEAGSYLIGTSDQSQVISGGNKIARAMFPPVLSEIKEVSRIENFDPNNISLFSEIRNIEQVTASIDPETFEVSQFKTVVQVVYNPIGYLTHVAKKMLETIEMAVWATIMATIISIPLAYFSAANYTENKLAYRSARAIVSFLRAVPELISAMFLVLMFGFGPIAGILALAFHAAGFLGKFYAEDIENAETGPQDALKAVGVSKLKRLRYAVLPNVIPQYVAYNMYILDRNIRMATVVGIVGAGGIGQELKGRYDMFDYGHVMTILLLIFLTVYTLDLVSSKIRSKLM
ncbi:phosphonate ABC transporter, permease protein PhnE [Ascidiaceihabitans sp.]|nr:phosphonate ABC transporter, permease protein PhnE [Ascidiaceihabitans sp.]